MKQLKGIFVLLVSSLIWISQAMAGTNPIGWALNQPFPDTVYSGINYSVTYTFTNNLPIKLIHPLVINKNASSNSEFYYTDTCTGILLNPNQTCTVQIHLSPLVSGDKFVQLSITGYDRNVVNLPQLNMHANAIITAGIVGTITQSLPNSMNAGSSANYIFTFTNYGNTDAINVSTTVTQTIGTPNTTVLCQGTLAKHGGSCTVQGSYTATSSTPSTQTVLASLNYSGVSGSPSKTSSTTTINTPNALIVGSIIVPYSLPPLMIQNQNPGLSVKFLFSNVSNGSVSLTNQGTISCTASDASNCSAAFTPPVSQCVNGSLGITQACSLTTTFNPPIPAVAPVTYTLTGSLDYVGLGHPATIATSGTVVTALPANRTIKMRNHCGFALSYSLNGAALPATAPTNPCPFGSTLLGGTCWWANHVGTSNILLAGAHDDITIPSSNYGGIQWSGNISASTGCAQPNGGSCTQAVCDNNGGSSSCAVSKGFSQPATQAEITMLANGVDSYDVEVINGFHIPIAMEPFFVIDTVPAPQTEGFSCGKPGNHFLGGGRTNGFGACDWETATPPAPTSYYYFVGGGSGTSCVSSPCAIPGEVCGLSQPNETGPISTQVCGNFQGYWTPNQLCTQAGSNLPAAIAAGLKCNTSTGFNLSPADQFNNTYTSLMACPVAKSYTGPTYNSCYTPSYPNGSEVSQCCGCVNWWDPTATIGGVNILANTTSTNCPSGQTDSLWTSQIQNGIQWMKQACPSVYVYPFDDATSKFTCTNNTQTGTNTTSYVITFCPGNNGLPAGATEGRG